MKPDHRNRRHAADVRDEVLADIVAGESSANLLAARHRISPRSVARYRAALRARGVPVRVPDGVGGFFDPFNLSSEG